ncbi:AAA family ATPase [Leptolyngbya sp. FACHB-711]|uniref:AAA family ATPase n=1 Tax=unclassified Leptolyngbya TaxID=2650499 RepID=UPI001684300F|nr:SMC family ATPase [Cyanobacteria bacterium FACHB-502]MBD2025943.1 SMC family ATPase [Leptolyngbya sp. FACHB-711]
MIPQQLTLKNFLSYREATLDFRGLNVACICGANGAGKSSLLEAIAWALWGASRALSEDDVIHQGAIEAQVDFVFEYQQHAYRVIRTRRRGQASSLEFQISTPNGFRTLTEKGIRATQQLILQHLKLDYETFINSAYLRQGRADEFMLKRPTDRKQILADLLKLEQYDDLAEQAKERSRQLKAEMTVLERTLESIAAQLAQPSLEADEASLRDTIQQLQTEQQQDGDRLSALRQLQQQRQAWMQQQTLQQQQVHPLKQDCQRLQQELKTLQQQQLQLESLLQNGEAIGAQYAQYQQLQREEEQLTAKFQAHQNALAQRSQLQQQQQAALGQIKDQLRQAQLQQETIAQQQQEIGQILSRAPEIEAALEQLRQARSHLAQLDQIQMQASPLTQRRQQVQTQLDRAQAKLTARLEEVQSLRQQLEAQQQTQPHLQKATLTVSEQISYLEKRRLYQQQVREKGMERRTFMERLQEQQRKCERELAELDHKLRMLQHDAAESGIQAGVQQLLQASRPAIHDGEDAQLSVVAAIESRFPSAFPPCPLCDRPLDEDHWHLVIERHQAQQQEIRNQLWVIREQLTTSDREIRVLRQEYRAVEIELEQYGTVLERRGQLQQQLYGVSEAQTRLQQVISEQIHLERSLQQQDYAADLQEELRLLDQRLTQLGYDDRNHALARGQVDRWRWAEVKQAELKQAQRKQSQLLEREPHIAKTIAALEQQLQQIPHSPLQQQIEAIDRHIQEIGYDLERHTALRQTLKQAQDIPLRYQELLQAQQHYPQLRQRMRDLTELWHDRTQALQTLAAQLQAIDHTLAQTPDPAADIRSIEQNLLLRRSRLDTQFAALGKLEQQRQQLLVLSNQQTALVEQLQTLHRQYRVHQELAQAFGKNGLQALMIENVLPQLEAEANQILGRLSANQLHVQFVTQRSRKSAQSGNHQSANKLIDTLDILISDTQGTRPYETYSGGEAFRVNFAIRLALARLLAQRSGTALQLLIIDEGFGTQDDAGCDRLIAAINAIAPDFACILTVTHIPHLKEAFQTRIEVHKTEQGSQIQLSV